MSRYKNKYIEEIRPLLQKKYAINIMEVPVLKKIVVSMGIAEAAKDKNLIQDHIKELTLLSGQKPITVKSKIAISNFKLREGQPIGLMVTLRGKRMYDFLDRFCNIVCPRIRDFRGFSTKGDGRGCYNLGLEDQQVYPELNLDEVKRAQGMNIALVTTAKDDEGCFELLKMFGFPFKQERDKHVI
ncbi:MAG: 50S ribosomal protein L5 [Chlamydiae bacterium]|nr:50S ribosomal protein L5 [Chlamydiota bacterium]